MDKFLLHIAKNMPRKELATELKKRASMYEENQTEENWKSLEAISYMLVLKGAIDGHGGVDGTSKAINQIKNGVELMQRMKM